MDGQQIGVIALVKSALTGEKAEVSENFDWDNALNTAKKHQIIPMLYYGVQYSGITTPTEIMQFLELATYKNIAVSQNQLYALEQIYKAFDENEIDYMPLKGSVLKFVYPKPELRPMGDADILIRQEQYEKIRPIMTGLGFSEILESDHELLWNKKGVLHVELHKRLIPSHNKDYYEYYGDGWRFAEHKENCRYDMRDEDNYIYLFTHYAKHYRDGGIGIRHMTDLYVFAAAHSELNYGYIEKELEKLQLLKFYKSTRHTLGVWFGGEMPDNMSDFITAKIFGSGSFGTHKDSVLSQALKATKSGETARSIKSKKIIHDLFLPYEAMCAKYHFLIKLPVLLPIMWIVRAFNVLLFKHNKIKNERENNSYITDDSVCQYQDDLTYVGLKFDFKE